MDLPFLKEKILNYLQMFNTGLTNLKASGEYQKILDQYLETGSEEAEDTGFFGLLKQSFPSLMSGLKMTLILTVVSLIIASASLGWFSDYSRCPKINYYVSFPLFMLISFRGTPLIVQAFFIYFGIPAALDIRISAVVSRSYYVKFKCRCLYGRNRSRGIQSLIRVKWKRP